MEDWWQGTEIENKIPNFTSTFVKYINGFRYYIDYNVCFDQVSFLEIDFLLEIDSRKFNLTIKFHDVSSLDLLGFGGSWNQLMGFTIRNMSKNGFEKDKRYLVEDYEQDIIHFYCATIEVLSLAEILKHN